MARRAILGRGCDPARAAFAKKQWEPMLNVDIDTATSDSEFIQLLTSGRKYEVFFIAPGQCSLIKSGRVDGRAMIDTARKHIPDIKVVMIDEVSNGLPILSRALDIGPLPGVAPMTEDWPFID